MTQEILGKLIALTLEAKKNSNEEDVLIVLAHDSKLGGVVNCVLGKLADLLATQLMAMENTPHYKELIEMSALAYNNLHKEDGKSECAESECKAGSSEKSAADSEKSE